MEAYPEELRTHPAPLVALVGAPDLHPILSSFLRQEHPPICALPLSEFPPLQALGGGRERKPVDVRSPLPPGILKMEWLLKHRNRVPAVIVLLIHHGCAIGDPALWLQTCSDLDNLKNIIRGRNTKLVVVVVQPTPSNGDANEDQMLALRKRAEVDSKCFLTFISQDGYEQNRSLARLGSILSELAIAFYKDEGKRVKQRLEKRTFSSIKLAVRYNFKVAVYAEFRRDWVEALKFYDAAYGLLLEILATPVELQGLIEVKAVAEQLSLRISTLLLRTRKEVEAIKCFQVHLAFFKSFEGPPETRFLHYDWVSKQILAFVELLQKSSIQSSPIAPSASDRAFQIAYYYQVAATYLVERRRAFESSSAIFEALDIVDDDVLDGPPETIGLPLYVGHASRLLNRGASWHLQRPTEKEFMLHAYKLEKPFRHSLVAISLFTKAYEKYKAMHAHRLVHYLASEIGREYFIAKDYVNAKKWFGDVAGVYRKEAWVVLLWTTLGYLRVCAKQLRLVKEYAEYTLEMASLPANEHKEEFFEPRENPAGSLSVTRREKLFHDAMVLLSEGGISEGDAQQIILEVDAVSPLRAVLSVCMAFHELSVKPGKPTLLTLALMTHLPLVFKLEQLDVCFNQPSCNFSLKSGNAETEALGIRSGFNLELEPNKWWRFETHVTPVQSGKLECLSATAHLGKSSIIHCQVESPALREDTSVWKFEPQIGISPMEDSSLSYFGQKAIQVDEPDALVSLTLEASGSGLVGELLPVRIAVNSRGHAMHGGKMKISMVESSKAPLMSPRDATTEQVASLSVVQIFTSDSASSEGMSPLKSFSGVMTVPPFVDENSSWSTCLYILWHKPQSVNLFVSLSYQSKPTVEHPQQLFVHRGLQLMCEEPFTVSYQHLLPFRRSALILGALPGKKQPKIRTIPANETTTLMLTAKNNCSVNLRLVSVAVDEKDASVCSVIPTDVSYGEVCSSFPLKSHYSISGDETSFTLKPGETSTRLFSVKPSAISPALDIGTARLVWRRETELGIGQRLEVEPIITTLPLPALQIEKPLLTIVLDCPPHVLLGTPFSISYKVQNQTALIQEIKYSVVDSPGFLFSGSHTNTIHVLPNSFDVFSYKLVPLTSGIQQLPQLSLTATRYNVGFQHSSSSIQIFVLPSAYAMGTLVKI